MTWHVKPDRMYSLKQSRRVSRPSLMNTPPIIIKLKNHVSLPLLYQLSRPSWPTHRRSSEGPGLNFINELWLNSVLTTSTILLPITCASRIINWVRFNQILQLACNMRPCWSLNIKTTVEWCFFKHKQVTRQINKTLLLSNNKIFSSLHRIIWTFLLVLMVAVAIMIRVSSYQRL